MALDPDNSDAKEEYEQLNSFLISEYSDDETPSTAPRPNHADPLDVIVVGAGASGVGVALMLTQTFGLDPERVLLVERGEGVGETFRKWPKEVRFWAMAGGAPPSSIPPPTVSTFRSLAPAPRKFLSDALHLPLVQQPGLDELLRPQFRGLRYVPRLHTAR